MHEGSTILDSRHGFCYKSRIVRVYIYIHISYSTLICFKAGLSKCLGTQACASGSASAHSRGACRLRMSEIPSRFFDVPTEVPTFHDKNETNFSIVLLFSEYGLARFDWEFKHCKDC